MKSKSQISYINSSISKNILLLILSAICLTANAQLPSTYQVGTWYQFKPAAVSYTFDDNCTKQIPVALPLFNQYGYKVTFFAVTGWGPNWSNLLNASNNGHEVASHTITHPVLNTLTVPQQDTELKNSQATIYTNIPNGKCVSVAYPNCITGDIPTISKYYIAGRTCSGSIVPNNFTDFFNISSFVTGANGSVKLASNFNSIVNSARTSNGWCVFLTHGIDNDGGYSPTQSSEIKTHLSYMSAHNADFWVGPFGDVARYTKERRAANLTEVALTSDSLEATLTDNLPDSIYNLPITLRRELPAGWQNTKVYANTTLIPSKQVTVSGTTYIQFDAIPDQGKIHLVNNTNPDQTGTVSIDSPTGGSTVITNSVTIEVSATDPDGDVVSIDFYDGTTYIGSSTASPFSFVWNNPSNGIHDISVNVTDINGGVTTSSSTSITVDIPSGLFPTAGNLVNSNIYPNPVNAEINVETSTNLENTTFRLLNAMGSELTIPFNISGKNATADSSGLLEGVYTLIIIHEDQLIASKKIVVLR